LKIKAQKFHLQTNLDFMLAVDIFF